MPDKKTVSIVGCGWYGFSLAESLINSGIIVKGSTTSVDKLPLLEAANIKPYLVSFLDGNNLYDPEFFDCDILWICIPPRIRTDNGDNYLHNIGNLINVIKQHSVKQVVFISSTGVYGQVNDTVNELSPTVPDSLSGKALLAAEDLLRQQTSFKTAIIRFAGLIGPGRDPGRFLAGKKDVPNGMAPVNLIHLTDCIGISCALLEKEAFGYTYNACSPGHPTRSEFYALAAARSGLEAPEFIAKKNNWKIISSINVNRLLNYKYQVDLMDWLNG
jgi:nucleoside-diphosphate-sugar epimerase